MKTLSVGLVIVFVLIGCQAGDDKGQGFIENGEFTQPLLGWKMTVPSGYTLSGLKEFKELAKSPGMQNLKKEIGGTSFDQIRAKSDFKKDRFNSLSIVVFGYDGDEDDWKNGIQETKLRNYNTFESYGKEVDSTQTLVVRVGGRKMLKYEFIIKKEDDHPALHQHVYGRLNNGYDINLTMFSDNGADDSLLVRTIENSPWVDPKK